MALLVGTDSYVTIEQADAYINAFYVNESPRAILWKGLTAEAKEIRLRGALVKIERLPYRGCKAVQNQKLQFPRCNQSSVPVEVGYAQVEQAVNDADSSKEADATFRAELKSQGVKSFSIGKLSESYASTGFLSSMSFVSPQAQQWLSTWIEGSFHIV